MTLNHKGSLVSKLIVAALVAILVLQASMPDVNAQETTEEPVVTAEPTVNPTEPADVLPTADPEIPGESTAVITPPATETAIPEATATTELPAEATSSVTEAPQLTTFSDDFENSPSDYWLLTGWEYLFDGTNTALASSSAHAEALFLAFSPSNTDIRAQAQIATNNTLEVAFRSGVEEYRVMFAANGASRLYRGETILDSGASVIGEVTEPVWFSFQILAVGNTVAVSVNDTVVLVYSDELPLTVGSVIFRTGGSNTGEVRLDNVAISAADPLTTVMPTELPTEPVVEIITTTAPATAIPATPEATAEITEEPLAEATAEATEEPLAEATAEVTEEPLAEATAEVTEEPLAEATAEVTAEPETPATKLSVELQRLLEISASDPATAADWFRGYGYLVDTDGRIGLYIGLVEEADNSVITALVTASNGAVISSTAHYVEALLPLSAVETIAAHPLVRIIDRLQGAASTGPVGSNANTPAGTFYTSGMDTLGFVDWHNQGITGSGVKIGIVDVGFAGEVGTAEYSCLTQRTSTFLDDTHGLNMIEVVCDIVPNAQIYTFEIIGGYSSLTNAVNTARNLGINVLIIAVDLGVHETSGDGTGRGDELDPYAALDMARAEGMVIFAAAGNNGINTLGGVGERVSRYTVLSIDATAGTKATVAIHASAGDYINVSWNDWEPGLGLSDPTRIEDFHLTLSKAGGNPITDYLAERTSVLDTPGTQLFVSAVPQVNPGLDYCGVSGTGLGNGDCDLLLEIERVKGDSPVIMQIQVIPRPVPALLGSPAERQSVNIEVTGVSGLNGASVVPGTGTLARPADSPAVVAVGAVCSNDLANYPVLPDSSVGPVFGDNGGLPTVNSPDSRAVVKPEIMSVAPVSTSISGTAIATACDGTIAGLDLTGGFGGTSAAAAHAGGLAALLLSNPNTSAYFTRDAVGAQRLVDYIQRHSADLPVLSPDGLDFTYGAGLAQLGSYNFNPANVQNIPAVPNLLTCTGNTYYVGQGQLEGPWNGSVTAPFLSIGQAVNVAASGDCIVVMPGEYVTPVYIAKNDLALYSYNSLSTNIFPASIIRVGAQYYSPDLVQPYKIPTYANSGDSYSYMQSAGIYIDSADEITIQGFAFVGSGTIKRHTIEDDSNPANKYSYQRNGIYIDIGFISNITGNTFGNSLVDGVSHPGWTENGSPIVIEGGAGHAIENNTFAGNTVGLFTDGSRDFRYTATFVVLNAGAGGSTLFRNNRVENNVAVEFGASPSDWASLLHSHQSYTDVIGNQFVNNQVNVAISSRTASETSDRWFRVVSNMFLSNISRTESFGNIPLGTSNPGPLVQAYFVRNLVFANNTVANNNLTNSGYYTGTFSAVLGRGDRTGAGIIGAGFPTERRFDFVNNFVYNNPTISQGIIVGVGACDGILSGANAAARANWWYQSGTTGVICNTSVTNAANRNITTINPLQTQLNTVTYPNARSGMFGDGSLTLNPAVDPLYYGIGIAHPNVAGDEEDDFYHLGVDYSNITTLGASVNLLAAPFNIDANGEPREFNVGNWEVISVTPINMNSYNSATGGVVGQTHTIDIGAFEFNRLSIVATPYVYNKVTGELVYREDPTPLPYIIINMDPAIQGGFGRLSFTLLTTPNTYGTQCGPEFTDENKGMFTGTGVNSQKIFYCPPRDFYTEDDIVADPLNSVPDFLVFTYEVRDEAGLSDEGEVHFYLLPEADPALAENIGDDNPAGDLFIATGNLGSNLRIQLRPFVRFDNFRFSESPNPNFLVGGDYMIQYPFVYALPVCDVNPPIIVGSPTWIDEGKGIINIALATDASGEVNCTYDVTDADNNLVTHTLKVRVVSRIPTNAGLYDDSSFAFEYLDPNGNPGGGWLAVEDERAINNTLHRTTAAGDRATFGFRGAGFVLHMFGESTLGGFWDMNIYVNGSPTPLEWDSWGPMNGSTRTYQRETTLGEFVCTTTAIRADLTATLSLTNTPIGSYTVSCTSYSSSSEVKVVEIINRDNFRRLTIDAFTLLKYSDGDSNGDNIEEMPLGPGTYYVSDPSIRASFGPSWVETANALYAGGVGFVSTAANPDDVSFKVLGATGVALGTTLETLGATFTLCVTNTDTGDMACQNHDTSPEARTVPTYRAYFPLYGLDQYTEYQVDILNIQTDTLGKMVIDSVTVFENTDAPLFEVAGGMEDDRIGAFFFGSGREDTWALNTADLLSSNKSLTSIRPGQSFIGPFIAFQVPDTTDTIFWTYQYRLPSQGVMICVDRGDMVGTTTSDSHGNCLLANLSTGEAHQILANGTPDPTAINIAVSQGTIIIDEDDFREPWTVGSHMIEIFSVRVGSFSMDKVVALGSGDPLPAGYYEEYASSMFYRNPATPAEVSGITYLNSDAATLAPLTFTTSALINTYPSVGFTQVSGIPAVRDSGSGIMFTTQVGNVISFEFTGTGFAPFFRMGSTTDAVKVCYAANSQTPAFTLANGTCLVFDNQNVRLFNKAPRPILGLANGTYTVAMQFLGDNFSPTNNLTPVEQMWFDGVQVYDTDLTTLTPLTPGAIYENSYINRVQNNQFAYFGTGWLTLSGPAARLYSGQNVDYLPRGDVGATIAFRVANSNGIVLVRNLSRAYTPVLVCAVNEVTGARTCNPISVDGIGYQNRIPVYFDDALTVANYTVTVTALDGMPFYFDAVEPVATTAPLVEGVYEENNPGIVYRYDAQNLVVNGDMEELNSWSLTGSPAILQSPVRYTGRFSRQITTFTNGEGITSTPFNLVAGERYTLIARVRIDMLMNGSVSMTVSPAIPAVGTIITSDVNRWVTIRRDFVAGSSGSYTIQFTGNPANPVTGLKFMIDDVQVVNGSNWITEYNPRLSGSYAMISKAHGSEFTFGFQGTGFGLGLITGLHGGETQVCWQPYTPPALPSPDAIVSYGMANSSCMVYENETLVLNTTTQRLITGLANGAYAVVVRDLEDGINSTGIVYPADRLFLNSVASIKLDYIRILDDVLPAGAASGNYNESAMDNTGEATQLALQPQANWGAVAGRLAARYSDQSYVTVIDPTGIQSRTQAGPAAVLPLNAGGAEATVILDVQAASRISSNQLLACVGTPSGYIVRNGASFRIMELDGVTESDNCVILSDLTTSRFVTINQDNLDAMANPGSAPLIIQTLTQGVFLIDGYQVIYGNTLVPGFYEETVGLNILNPVTGNWTTEPGVLYSGGAALVLNNSTGANPTGELSFNFQGTGISIVTAYLSTGGNMTVTVTGTINPDPVVVDTRYLGAAYGSSVSITGLPNDTYTVTINAANDALEKVVIDAIRIYDDLQQLGSLYDDALTDSDGIPYITYGPGSTTWTALTGRLAFGALNETLHQTRSYGAVASFRIRNTSPGITIYYDRLKTTAPSIDVCFRDEVTGALDNGSCQTIVLTGGNGRVSVFPTVLGNYTVSIINSGLVSGSLALDAVQVLESGLYEGIFTAQDLNQQPNPPVNTAGSFNAVTNTYELLNGQYMELEVNGIAFSLLIDNVFGSSTAYTLCVETGPLPYTGTCDLVNDTLPLAGDAPVGISALTYTGLHGASGFSQTFTVRITNTSTGLLRVKGLHVLGDSTISRISDTSRYENDGVQLRYLPFGSLTELETRAGQASGLSEQVGRMQGSVAYFEFTDNPDTLAPANEDFNFEYFRQRSYLNGNVEICYGQIGVQTLDDARDNSQCTPVSNYGLPVYQVGVSVPTTVDCSTGNGCWASIRNVETKSFPVDFVRLYDASSAMRSGYYEDTYPGLVYIDGSGDSIETRETFLDIRASGGSVARYIVNDADNDLTEGNGPVMSFRMEGTGFSVYFTSDLKADAVNICYVPYTGTETYGDALDNGRCQQFDNESRVLTYGNARTIMGLPYGEYIVAVQMLADQGSTAFHLITALPLTMQIDAVRVYDTDWVDLLSLFSDERYETNFTTRAVSNEFGYIGETWQTFEGNAAIRNSGRNYDTIRASGAGIVFRTTGVDAITLYTDLRRGFAPIRICATPLAGVSPNFTLDGDTLCRDYALDGTGNQQPLTFRFTDFNEAASNRYVVTLTTLNNAQFVLDAIETHYTDAPGNILYGGLYEETHENLFFDSQYQSLVANGTMEQNGHWYPGGVLPDNLNSSAQSLLYRYEGRASWQVNANASAGIKSEPFALTGVGEIYTAIARVMVTSGEMRMKIVPGNDPNSIIEFRPLTPISGPTANQWVTMRVDFRLNNAYDNVTMQFAATRSGTQFMVDDVALIRGGLWAGEYSRLYSGGSLYRSSTHGSSLYFSFIGTGFQVGTYVDNQGGEMEICYDNDVVFDETADSTPQSCFTYQQETLRPQVLPRTIAGLQNGTYHVRVRDLEDGQTVNIRLRPTMPRISRFSVGRLAIDYVRIFDDTTQPIVAPGYYDNTSVDPSLNEPYLQLEPANAWGQISGVVARLWRNSTYTTAVDTFGRLNLRDAGQSASIFINVPVDGATVILYTNPVPTVRNSSQLLICAGNGMAGEITWDGTLFGMSSPTTPGQCVLRSMTTSNTVVVSSSDLAALGTPSVDPVRVSFTTLTPGEFSIDAFQVIHGSTLTPGIYDDVLPDLLLDFDTPANELPNRQVICNMRDFWCQMKNTLAYGGSTLRTQSYNAALKFSITGTGFSVLSSVGLGADMRICYAQTPVSGSISFPSTNQTVNSAGDFIWQNSQQDLSAGGIWCDLVTTNTSVLTWNRRTPTRINPLRGEQYGFAYYGLPYGNYTVEVRMVQQLPIVTAYTLSLDGVVVFGNRSTLPILYGGFYDNIEAAESVSYEPGVNWNELVSRLSPPRGPFNFTEMNAANAGSVAQMRVYGNAVTLYQTAGVRSSRDIRVCMPVTGAVIHCTPEAGINAADILDQTNLPTYALAMELANFSQNGRPSYFMPVMFYGLGTGSHEIIMENRDHARTFSIDAIEVRE